MSTVDPELASTTTGVGLGYGIAIAVSILVLISTIMLASYACVRVKASGGLRAATPEAQTSTNRRRHSTSSEPVVLVVGLNSIESYPKMVLGESKRLPRPNNGPCSICLSEYRAKDTIRCVPECNHCFHADCVDAWLRVSGTCPMCRNSPAPTPVATPLSELVPLAFHPR